MSRPVGIEIAVFFLGRRNDGNQNIHTFFEFAIGLGAQRIRSCLDRLVQIRIAKSSSYVGCLVT
jgi:hypothetical protein